MTITKLQTITLAIIYITIITFFSGCGGGSSKTNTASNEISYSGLKTQATIDEKNAMSLTWRALAAKGIDPNTISSSYEIVITNAIGVADFLQISTMPILIFAELQHDQIEPLAQSAEITISPSKPETGICGGSFVDTIDSCTKTGEFSGTMEYKDFCFVSEGNTVSGILKYTGKIDLEAENYTQQIIYKDFSLRSGERSGKANGILSIESNSHATIQTLSMNMYITDLALNKTYWAKDFIIHEDKETGKKIETFTGRFYHPDYGYVDVSTYDPIIVEGRTNTNGSIIATGGIGADGINTQAMYNILTKILKIDADGDGIFEIQQ